MSTVSKAAEYDLAHAIPCCSRDVLPRSLSNLIDPSDPGLCMDVIEQIFEKMAVTSPIVHVLKMKILNSRVARSIDRALAKHDHLQIDIREPIQYRFCGMERVKLETPEPIIYVQGSRVPADTAMTLVQYLLKEMRIIRKLSLTSEDIDQTLFNLLVDEVLKAENVKLERLEVRRRQGGVQLPKVVELVKKHKTSLKYISKIGIKEAADALRPEMNLDRLSIMTHDLGMPASPSKIFDMIKIITSSGAKFKHLSYTSLIGFDPTEDYVQDMLDTCEVESLRLTMMKPPKIMCQPDYMIGKKMRPRRTSNTDMEQSAEETDFEEEIEEQRRRKNRQSMRSSRIREGSQQRQLRHQSDRERHAANISDEPNSERIARLQTLRTRARERRITESSEERIARLQNLRRRTTERRSTESSEERIARLQTLRRRTTERRSTESSEERIARLQTLRIRTEERRSTESSEERIARLQTLRTRTTERRSTESSEERIARLQTLRKRTADRRSTESSEERIARLQTLRISTRERRITESSEERQHERSINRNQHSRARQNESVSERRSRLDREMQRRRSLNIGAAGNSSLPNENYLGPMNKICVNCGAFHFPGESNNHGVYNVCCNYGTVIINPFTHYPAFLKDLLTEQTSDAKNFRNYIRNYNSALAMASMGAHFDIPAGRGPYCFRIHDQVYHLIGSLHPEGGKRPLYGQIYILDTDIALEERMANPANVECNRTIMDNLGTYLLRKNPFARSFKMMKDVLDQETRIAKREGRSAEPVRMVFDINEHLDRRRFNVPVTSEVAIVFVGDEDDMPAKRAYAVHDLGGGLKNIRDIDPECDPLIYPILFPNGETGWHTELRRANGKRISQMDYYSSMIQERGTFNPLFRSGKLFQQFIVDSFVKIEQNRLNFARTHQKELRADSYKSLQTFVSEEDTDGPPGKRVILPSSFKSGPRGMQQSYRDAMAIVAKYGKPDYFLTITCNPKWREIEEQLKEGQSASDRPDIVAKVFHLKLQELFADLFKHNVLGEVEAYVSVIEFQKRGLPHSHNLLIMKNDYKPKTAEIVDCYVSAEIPDPAVNPRLYEIVKSMVHRPCGAINKKSPCMINNKCSKRFPKDFQNETSLEGDSYPKYRRRNDGRAIQLGDHSVDNRWIVPYSPYLSSKYNCHINLEVCALISAVMYLYKYVYKGTDQAALKLSRQAEIGASGSDGAHDEITAYLKTRYLCAPEAAHRIFGFEMQKRSHGVEVLAVHLPDEESVVFEAGNEEAALMERCPTTLIAWFNKNRESGQIYGAAVTANENDSRQYTYPEMPEHFTFRNHKWNLRKQVCKTIGRIQSCFPKDLERFSLRLLLLNRKGAKSFNDLKTINGQLYETYTETAKELDLLHDDSYFIKCIEEASLFQTPKELRSLFACLIVFTDVLNPQEIWDKFTTSFSADYIYQGHSESEAIALAYYDVLDRTANQGVDLTLRVSPPTTHRPVFHSDDIDYNVCETTGNAMYLTLNKAQKLFVDEVLNGTETQTQKLLYIDGPGGSGKTYVYNTLCNILTGQHLKVLNVAWTGIAAELLPHGRTVSSTFRLPIHEGQKTSNMKRQSKEAQYLKSVSAIFWDEAPMSPKEAFEAVDLLLRDIMQNNLPFGGKTVILGGDFRQTLPIVERGGEEECVQACIKHSHLWSLFTVHTLTHNMRLAPGNDEWSKYLLRVGNDEEPKDSEGRIDISPSILLKENESLIDAVFGDAIENNDINAMINRAILMPKNVDALKMNLDILAKLPGEEKIYRSIDEAVTDDSAEPAVEYEQEFLNRLTPTGFPPNELHLKEGAIVMLLRNLDVSAGLCNGTRLIIRQMGHRVLGCEIATGTKKGQFVFVPRIDNYTDKVRRVTHIEMGEVVDKPAYFNSLAPLEGTFKKVFPNVDYIHFFQQW